MYTLLIADDDYEIRNGLSKYFPWDTIGFRVVGNAENGRQAMDYVSQHKVDVVLCDIKMPVMSGLELAREIHAKYEDVSVILYSAYKDFEYAQQALEAGVKRYLLKSTNYQELVNAFERIKMELDKGAQTDKDAESDGSYSEKVISTVKRYTEEHYKEVTLEKLAELVYMNPDYLSKFFKKHAGMLFSEYLTKVRMEKAAQFLGDIRYKVYEISDLVGYSNSFNFSRAFKQYYKMSPREYRDRKIHPSD